MKKSIVTAAIALGLAASASAATQSGTISDATTTVTLSALVDSSWIDIVGKTASADLCTSILGVTTNSDGIIAIKPGYSSSSGTITSSGVYGTTTSVGTSATGNYYAASSDTAYYIGEDAQEESTYTISNFVSSVDWSQVDTLALTLVVTSSGTTIYASYELDGTVYTYSGTATGLRYTTSGTVYSTYSYEDTYVDASTVTVSTSALTASEAVKLNTSLLTASVPEPATATLSLLALAGLAARRRRK